MFRTRSSFRCKVFWSVTQCVLYISFLLSSWSCSAETDYPFRNTSLSWDTRVNDLVDRLTLKEIMLQMSKGGSGPNAGPAPHIPRLGIGPYSWNTECLRGDVSAGNATSFPQALGLAATFSTDVIHDVAEATGVEVRAKYNDYRKHKQYGDHKGASCFSPVINIMRHPLWGRNQETYGEDPFLSGVMAAHFVKGLQGQNPTYIRASAGCKHFDVHGGPDNIPVSRFSFDAQVSERDWRLTFLPAFKRCVEAGTFSLMCSYNRLNGIPACGNKRLLTDILRKEWGFKGYVVSDQEAIENIINFHHYLNNTVDTVALCVNAGCNLELSTNEAIPVYFSMIDAIRSGKLTEKVVRARVKPLFYTRMRLGEFDPPDLNPYNFLGLSNIQSANHRMKSLEAAMKSFVLLKNVNNLLPFHKSFQKIAVVGPMANNLDQLFGDYSADASRQYTTTPLDGLKHLAQITNYGQGCPDNRCVHYNATQVKTAVANTEVVFVCLGTGQELEKEGNDRISMDLPGHQLQLMKDAVRFAGNAPVILLLFNAGPLNISWAEQSGCVGAILECFFPAQAAGEAIFSVLTSNGENSNPAGRLPFTWPMYDNQVPFISNYSMEGRTYRYFKGDPLYPFGFGLSYSKFHYYDAWLSPYISAGKPARVKVEVGNSGPYDGDEVIQIYLEWITTKMPMPRLQLVAFRRVFIKVNDTVTYTLEIQPSDMAVWTGSAFVIEQGTMRIYIGGQQPNQKMSVPSNILVREFHIAN
ncbi:probable beta-D-xylosidase 5 [Mizuhopecten yessoensis]|uniref:Beta-D-xylosidase 5 n=1 Tax=Mizuhopecten yessoensis TaxID=6573 RepID=A0A210PRS1_MIZYE|nr:probable beta-D-xylosidase 5 [Mizuhopecten yessoensis]OWF39181.1 beta-D-xylosidase 5 [Mizuhopecten yessoensis]